MPLTDEQIRHCLHRAREINGLYTQYVLAGDGPKKSIDDFLHVCRDYVEDEIVIKNVMQVGQGPTKAAFLRYSDRYEIYIRSDISGRWYRYVLCKELFHVIIDREDCRDMEIVELVEQLTLPNLSSAPAPAVLWEYLAEISAMEFLFPYSDRVPLMQSGDEIDYEEIAERYGLPLVHIEQYLSPPIMAFLDAFRTDN